jgi:putative transposase
MKRQNHSSNSQQIALWRYERLEQALDQSLSATERGRILRQVSDAPVVWPSGKRKKISLATLYRWNAQFCRAGLQALRPKPRKDRGCIRQKLPEHVVQEALRLLTEDPTMTLTFMLAVLSATFAPAQVHITRSTLARRLAALPAYVRIKQAQKRIGRRTRFVANAPHQIWQMDAKGPVQIRLISGSTLVFHILSIIDDATRYVLAALVVLSPNLGAAVRVFRMAALRWGLPNSLYADKASIFDSKAFRMGLAQMGSYRIPTRPRNAEARGKIEAYHRTLVKWFTDRLPHQQVIDQVHLQQLLNGVLSSLYHPHKHRSLGCSPEQALSGRVSDRSVPASRLFDAFMQEKSLKAHPKTGEVVIDAVTYLVADELRGKRLLFLVDPPGEVAPVVVHPHSGQKLQLRRAAIGAEDVADDSHSKSETELRWAPGPLQAIYDGLGAAAGRPLAEPGFGLPEIYALLAKVCARHVPASDAEAALIQDTYRRVGPFTRAATEKSLDVIARQLGPARPIKTYLDALVRRVENHPQNKP